MTGLGPRGSHWVDQLLKRDDIEIVAYVEPAAQIAEQAIEQFNLDRRSVFDTLDDAVSSVSADFVCDVTPPGVHHVIAQKAFDNGLHLLQEKPLSNDFSVAQQTVAAGRAAGMRHMITQNYRFHPCPRTTRRVLDEGLIGQVGQVDLRWYMNWADIPGSFYVTAPYMLINDMMVHHFDMMRYVLNADPVTVHAITWNHPWSWLKGDSAHVIVFEYPGGMRATHVSLGAAVGKCTTYWGDWSINGSRGSITWELDRMWHSHLHRTDEPVNREILPDDVPDQYVAIVDEFFCAIDENRDPECCAADNLKSLTMVFGAIKSTVEERRVSLDEHINL
jgi:predicted dehydrogenase